MSAQTFIDKLKYRPRLIAVKHFGAGTASPWRQLGW
jgi:hypothetical protein